MLFGVLVLGVGLVCPHVVTASGPTNVYEGTYSEVGTSVRVETYEKRTVVTLSVTGMPPGRTYGAHVHQKECGPAPGDAGPHYQNPDAAPGTPVHDKEVWLDFAVGPDGKGSGVARVGWPIGSGAGSVVIHAEATHPETGDAGARLVCTSVPFGS